MHFLLKLCSAQYFMRPLTGIVQPLVAQILETTLPFSDSMSTSGARAPADPDGGFAWPPTDDEEEYEDEYDDEYDDEDEYYEDY